MLSFLTKTNDILTSLNTSKILIGVAMILFNIGSKYIIIDISKSQEQFFKNTIIRRITLFCIFFVATRDIKTSLLLTAIFVILVQGLFHEESKFAIIKPSFYDNIYTKEEYEMSKKIITEYEKEHSNLNFCKNKSI